MTLVGDYILLFQPRNNNAPASLRILARNEQRTLLGEFFGDDAVLIHGVLSAMYEEARKLGPRADV